MFKAIFNLATWLNSKEDVVDFHKFADLMENIGFRDNEPIAPTFRLNSSDLKNPVFRGAYTKVAGRYQVVSMWSQDGEVALWAQESRSGTEFFPFHKEEVDFLAEKKKFKKN